MIIVDLNQIMISNLMVQINGRNAVELSEDLVRHMVLKFTSWSLQKIS